MLRNWMSGQTTPLHGWIKSVGATTPAARPIPQHRRLRCRERIHAFRSNCDIASISFNREKRKTHEI